MNQANHSPDPAPAPGASPAGRAPRRFYIALGMLASPFVLLGYSAFKRQFPSFEYAFGTCLLAGILISLPFVLVKAKKEAVPAKRGDLVGYAVILAVLISVAGVAYSVLK